MTELTMTFNPRELDVLNILINSPEALTNKDIVDCSSNQLTQSTVITVLRKLLNAGYIESVGTVYSGKVLSRTYRATELAHKDIVELCAKLYQPFLPVLGISSLIKSLISLCDEDAQKKLIEEIKEL